MPRLFLISLLFVLVLLGTVVPVAVFAQTPRPVPAGEGTRDQAYVPCGDLDTKDSKGNTVMQKVSGPPDKDGKPTEIEVPGDGIVDNPCQFTDIIVLAKKIIMGWIIFGTVFSTAGFAYAGLLYITSMGSSEKISHAHMIFVKTFWGFVFMLSAWLIAYTMESIFLSDKAKENSFLLDKKAS